MGKIRPNFSATVVALILGAFMSFSAGAASETAESLTFAPETIRAVFDKFEQALVIVEYSVEYYDPGRQQNVKRDFYCLGVVVDKTGLVMVRGHVSLPNVKPFNIRVRLSSGARYDATVLQKDRKINVAFVKLVPGIGKDGTKETFDLPFVSFAKNPVLEVGDEIMVVGILPEVLNFERTFVVGHISSVIETPRRVFVTDFPVAYGMVGGPVINARGEVIGVIGYDLAPAEGGEIYIRYGYPLIYTADLFQHLIEHPPTEEQVRQEAWLGVFTQPLTDDLAQYWGLDKTGGIVVSTIMKDSPAERVGLLRGDVIKVFDGKPVSAKEDTDVIDFTRLVRESGTGRTVPMTIIRGGKEMHLDVTLTESPKGIAEAEKYEDKEFGLTVREITEDLIIVADLDPGVKGVVVDRVEGAGWVSLGGLIPGDIIKEIDGKQVASIEEFKEVLTDIKKRKPKEVIIFTERGRRTGFLRIEPDWKG